MADRILPPGLDANAFDKALTAMKAALGDEKIFATELDRDTYIDPYALGDGLDHAASSAIAPQSVEEVLAMTQAGDLE